MLRIAVLASGRGSNFNAVLQATLRGELPARVVGLFSDRPKCGAMELAAMHGVPAVAVRPREHPSREDFDREFFAQVDRVQPDLIVCAGYMRLISADEAARRQGRMINIHPSLLPRYPGLDTHARALAAGDAEHGASVHYVIPALDAGPVISQVRVPVLPGDDAQALAARVIAREHPLYVATIREIARGRVRMAGDGVERDGAVLRSPLQLDVQDRLQ